MSFMAIPSITGFIISLISGSYILNKNPESPFNRMLFVFSALVSFLLLSDFGLYIAESYFMAYFWLKMGFLWPLVPSVLLHMVVLFTRRKSPTALFLLVIYVPSFLIALAEIMTNLVTGVPVMSPWGWTFRLAGPSTFYVLSTLWGFTLGLLAITLTVKYYTGASGIEKKQTRYLFAGLMVPLIVGFSTDFLIPSLGLSVPSLTNIAAAVGVLIIAVGVLKFKIPFLSPKSAVVDIVNTMNNFLIITDLEFKVIYANPAAERITGFRSSEFEDMRLEDVIELGGNLSRLLDSAPVEATLKRVDGLNVPVVLSIGYIHGSDREHIGLVFTGSDISDIKKMERKLKEREERLRLLTENMADGLGELDTDFRFRYLSPSIGKVVGYDYRGAIGKSALDFIEYIYPEDRETIRKAIADGRDSHNVEFRLRKPDGSYSWFEYIDRPLYTSSMELRGYVFGLRDINAHKMAQEALKISEEKFRELFRNINSGIIVLRRENGVFRVSSMNQQAERIDSVRCDEIKGMDISDAIPAFRDSGILEVIEKVYKTGEPSHCPEVRYGQGAWREIYTYRLSTGDIVVISDDITLRKEYEEKLKRSLTEKEALIREVHHRVKNNFQIISSLINLQSSFVKDQSIFKDLQSRVQSMAMVHQLLYESEDITNIDFASYVDRVASSLFNSFNVSDKIKLKTEIEDLSLPIETAVPLGLILNELITNAIKHAFVDEGEVMVRLKNSGEKVILSVSDNGVGLPEDLDIEKTDSLGLKLIKGLVNQLEGEMRIITGNGTEFKITFPAKQFPEVA